MCIVILKTLLIYFLTYIYGRYICKLFTTNNDNDDGDKMIVIIMLDNDCCVFSDKKVPLSLLIG